ncbi:YceI family protein [Streptomyces sp. 8K308]|uniref:YceI family protein n=1 Tax=Streptomyces sp. 8K308 TaxID=2530388 RepID=UPI0010501066|nr:YceI family protein [Streptomyces sp. 8K308]TDC20999.1 YceI family protein [Streptomyces sp. 8K308]
MTVAVETGTWQLDRTASTVAIRHRTMWGLVTVKGAFAAVSGQGEVRADGTASGVLTLDVATLDTGHAKRDKHLRSADFFDAERHPEITFTANEARPGGDGTVRVDGRLTVRGVSRPLSLTATLTDVSGDALTLDAEFTVDRARFEMGWNQLGMMRGVATVTASLRFTRAAG